MKIEDFLTADEIALLTRRVRHPVFCLRERDGSKCCRYVLLSGWDRVKKARVTSCSMVLSPACDIIAVKESARRAFVDLLQFLGLKPGWSPRIP